MAYVRNNGRSVIVAGTYAAMIAALDLEKAAGNLEAVGELHTGGVVTATSLIGRWQWDATKSAYIPQGDVHLDRVTDSRVAVIGAGITGTDVNNAEDAIAPQDITEADTVGGWAEVGGTGATLATEASDGLYGRGDYAIVLTSGTANTNTRMFDTFTVESGVDYLVSYWAKTTVPESQRFTTATAFVINQELRNTDWQFYQHRVTSAATALTVSIIVEVSDTDPTHKVHVASLSILKIDDASTKIACNPDHNVVATDTLTIWDVSAGDTDDTGVTIDSIDGRFINLDSALAQTPEAGIDYAHAEGTCEFGELRSDGLWRPDTDSRMWWASGIYVPHELESAAGAHKRLRLLFLGNSGAVTEPFLTEVHAHLATTDYSLGTTSYVMLGVYSALHLSIVGPYNNVGTWVRAQLHNLISSYTGKIGAALDALESADMEILHSITESSATNIDDVFQVKGTGLTVAAAYQLLLNKSQVGQGANGPYLGVMIGYAARTVGSLLFTISKIRVEWGP